MPLPIADGIPLYVHWIRHGRVASHRGDVPITEEGLAEAEEAARRMAAQIQPGELVFLLQTETLRSSETATVMHSVMRAALDGRSGILGVKAPELLAPRAHPAIRNPDLYIGGMRVEMVSTAEAMAEQTACLGIGRELAARLPFYRDFFPSLDRIGYWVSHPDPPGENADAVARRMMTFAVSLLDLPRERAHRYVCVTHSPLLRAFLSRYVLDHDPGEPRFMESIDLTFPGDSGPGHPSYKLVMRFRDTVKTILSAHSPPWPR
jgi:broad specificity phosphatase PhoE